MFFVIPMFWPQYNVRIVLTMTRAFWQYLICGGPLDWSGLGSGHDTTWTWATLQLAVCKLQYVLQHIVINKIIVSKKLVLVFSLQFSVALAQNTTGVTSATTMATAGGNVPLAPNMRPCTSRRRFEWMGYNPPSLWMCFLGGLRVFMALKVLLCSGDDASPQHRSVLRAIHTLNSRKNYIRLLRGLLPIHLMCLHGAQGLMWGTRGAFLPVVAMVSYKLGWSMLAVGGWRQINLL